MITLRPFQSKLEADIFAAWQHGSKAVIGVAPTGAGKTVIMSSVAHKSAVPMCIIAHRHELVQQISMALCRMGLRHKIIASETTIRTIISAQVAEFGQSYVDRMSSVTVSSVATLTKRVAKDASLKQWANSIKIWMIDECHHVLLENIWGKATQLFKNAVGVGFTASPIRCDRKSLKLGQGGVFDEMVVGPTMRELIDQGYLCDYRIFGPPQSIRTEDLKVSKSTGDYTNPSLRQAAEQSTITGDIVTHYLSIASGKRGITFTVDVDSANRTADAFNAAGVPAAAVSSKTDDSVRNALIDKFRRGELLQLVNVDLFGEGFDVPAVEVVSMGRPTQSFGLYLQQFGRALRPLEGKERGIIIDHVGNVKMHGLPDAVRGWSLDGEGSGRRTIRDPDVMPVKTCEACFMAFEAVTKICPMCGHVHEPENRSEPKFVDGDLIEFDEELLKQLRAEAAKIDSDFVPVLQHLQGTPAEGRLNRVHGENQMAQAALRETIALWAGVRRDRGMQNSEIYRRFFHTFGVDILSAQSLKRAEAEQLQERITEGYWK